MDPPRLLLQFLYPDLSSCLDFPQWTVSQDMAANKLFLLKLLLVMAFITAIEIYLGLSVPVSPRTRSSECLIQRKSSLEILPMTDG